MFAVAMALMVERHVERIDLAIVGRAARQGGVVVIPLLFEVDAVHPIDYTERVNIGFEYGYNKMLFLRGGYKFNHDTEGLSLGVGFSLQLLGFMTNLSYSFNDAGDFSPVNRISVGVSL